MIPFRSCFHLKAFPVQSATQSEPCRRDTELGFGAFSGEEKPVKHLLKVVCILAFFDCDWQTRNSRKL
jgi:hypothetical protein